MDKRSIDVYYTVNSGIYLWNGVHGLMIDYLFEGGSGWSEMPEGCLDRMCRGLGEFRHSHTLLFSHRHSDHFSEKLVRMHRDAYPAARCLVPDPGEMTALRFETGGWTVCLVPAMHQGRENRRDDTVYVICAYTAGQWFIHFNDAAADEELFGRLKDEGIFAPAAVFVNLYHMAEPDILREMGAAHVFCIHLPFEKDDLFGFRRQCGQMIQKNRDRLPAHIRLAEPLTRLLPDLSAHFRGRDAGALNL